MNKHTRKQLNALENEQRFVQKTETKKKTVAKKKTTAKKDKKQGAVAVKAPAAVAEVATVEKIQSTGKVNQDPPPAQAEPDQAAIDAAGLEWALTVIKYNLTSKWIEEEV